MADVTITAANVLASNSAKRFKGVAGAAITAGQPVYRDATDGNSLKLADADASAAAAAVVGIALHGAADGQPLECAYEDPDFTPGFTLDVTGAGAKGVYGLSGTAGGVCPVADFAAADFPTVLYVAKSSTKAVLKIMSGGAALT